MIRKFQYFLAEHRAILKNDPSSNSVINRRCYRMREGEGHRRNVTSQLGLQDITLPKKKAPHNMLETDECVVFAIGMLD